MNEHRWYTEDVEEDYHLLKKNREHKERLKTGIKRQLTKRERKNINAIFRFKRSDGMNKHIVAAKKRGACIEVNFNDRGRNKHLKDRYLHVIMHNHNEHTENTRARKKLTMKPGDHGKRINNPKFDDDIEQEVYAPSRTSNAAMYQNQIINGDDDYDYGSSSSSDDGDYHDSGAYTDSNFSAGSDDDIISSMSRVNLGSETDDWVTEMMKPRRFDVFGTRGAFKTSYPHKSIEMRHTQYSAPNAHKVAQGIKVNRANERKKAEARMKSRQTSSHHSSPRPARSAQPPSTGIVRDTQKTAHHISEPKPRFVKQAQIAKPTSSSNGVLGYCSGNIRGVLHDLTNRGIR